MAKLGSDGPLDIDSGISISLFISVCLISHHTLWKVTSSVKLLFIVVASVAVILRRELVHKLLMPWTQSAQGRAPEHTTPHR